MKTLILSVIAGLSLIVALACGRQDPINVNYKTGHDRYCPKTGCLDKSGQCHGEKPW